MILNLCVVGYYITKPHFSSINEKNIPIKEQET